MKFLTKRLVIGAIILIGIVAVHFSGWGEYVTLANIKVNLNFLKMQVNQNYVFSVLTYIGIYFCMVIIALPFASLLTLTGGFLFGVVPAVIYTNIGATLGAIGSFLLVRYMFGNGLQKQYAGRLAKFNAAVAKQGSSYLLAVRFVSLVPFAVVNVLAGLTKIPLSRFVWTTAIGIIPGSFVYALAGQQLHNIEQIRDIFSPSIIVAFVLLVVLALLPVIIKKIKRGD